MKQWLVDTAERTASTFVQTFIGLMQVMPMWADDCGGIPADLFDPTFNLRCALHVHGVQGWPAWSTY